MLCFGFFYCLLLVCLVVCHVGLIVFEGRYYATEKMAGGSGKKLQKPYLYRPKIVSAEVAQLVEHQLPKLRVAGSNLVFRSE